MSHQFEHISPAQQDSITKSLEETLAELIAAITIARPKEPPDQQPVATPMPRWSFPPSITQPPMGIKVWALPRLRLEPPRFDGENAPDWIRKIQEYYNYHYTPLDDRLYLTQYLFDPPTSDWREYWEVTNKGKSWDDFLLAVAQRFDPEFYKPYVATGRDQRKPNRKTACLVANQELDYQPPQRKEEVTQVSVNQFGVLPVTVTVSSNNFANRSGSNSTICDSEVTVDANNVALDSELYEGVSIDLPLELVADKVPSIVNALNDGTALSVSSQLSTDPSFVAIPCDGVNGPDVCHSIRSPQKDPQYAETTTPSYSDLKRPHLEQQSLLTVSDLKVLDGKITEETAGQITEETAEILNKRKPCSSYKPKAMNDSGDGSTGSGAFDDNFKCRTSVCIVPRAPLTAGDGSNPRLLENEKFACFDDTSDAGPKPLFSDGRKSCLEPNTLLGVGRQDEFRQEQTLASDSRSIPPRKDLTRSGGSLSSSLRQSDSSTMLAIGELCERIDTLQISPFLPLTPVVENCLWGYGPLQPADAYYLHNFSFRELMGDDRRVHSFVRGGSFVVKFSNKKFTDQEQICGYIAFFPKVEPLIAGEQFLIASYYDKVVPFCLLFFALGVPNDRVMARRLAPDIIGAASNEQVCLESADRIQKMLSLHIRFLVPYFGGIFYLEWNARVGVLEDESNGQGGDSDSGTGHLDLCGDTRTLPPRETRHRRAIPICFQIVANQSQREMLLSRHSAIGVNGVAQVPFEFNSNEDITQSNSGNICEDQINLEEFNGGDRSNNKYKLGVKFSKTSDPKHAVLVRTVNACGGSKQLSSLRTLSGHMRRHSIKKKGVHLFKECDRRFETMRARFGDIKSYSQRMVKVSSIVEPGVNGSHCDVSKLDEVKGIAAAPELYEVFQAATGVYEEFVLNVVDEVGPTSYRRLKMLHISDNLHLSDRLKDKKRKAGVLLQLSLLGQNQWLNRLATLVASLLLSIFVIVIPQVQWLMHHFPNLRLEDKTIFIGGGVDRDSNITTPPPSNVLRGRGPKEVKIHAYLGTSLVYYYFYS